MAASLRRTSRRSSSRTSWAASRSTVSATSRASKGPTRRRTRSNRAPVEVARPDATGRSRRRRSAQSPPHAPRGARPPARRRDLRLPPARSARARQGQHDRPRGDERDRRAGDHDARRPARRALAAVGAVGGHQRDVQAEGPLGARPLPRHDARGGRGVARRARDPLVQGPAADLVSDPDQGAGRGAATLGRPPDARVPHEGLLHARPRRRGARPIVCRARAGLPADLRSLRPALLRRAVGHRHDGRPRLARVHGAERGGEDEVALCAGCGYAANVELARGVPAAPAFPAWTRQEVATPNVRTIAEVSQLLGIDPRLTLKSLLYVAKTSGPVLVLVRGDHALHERKLARALGEEFRAAHPDEVRGALGAPAGSVGPVGARVPIVADEALRTGPYVVGANREGFHLKGVAPGRDFECRFADLHAVAPGEACTGCGKPLAVEDRK